LLTALLATLLPALTTMLAALTTMLAALAGILRLLTGLLLLAALLLTGLLLAALLAWVRVLRILAHHFLPWEPRPMRQRRNDTIVPGPPGNKDALVHDVQSMARRCLVKGKRSER
jgi:hypothetical protein